MPVDGRGGGVLPPLCAPPPRGYATVDLSKYIQIQFQVYLTCSQKAKLKNLSKQ